MKYIILFFITLFYLSANCTISEIELSDKLFFEAQHEEKKERKIELLQSSIDACYAPELKAFLLLLKSQSATNQEKIAYYKELIGVAGEFEADIPKAIELQNECYLNLSKLYKTTDPKLAEDYRGKIQEANRPISTESNVVFKYSLIFLIFALFSFIARLSFKR